MEEIITVFWEIPFVKVVVFAGGGLLISYLLAEVTSHKIRSKNAMSSQRNNCSICLDRHDISRCTKALCAE
jgi:hypothetical protein